MVQNLNIDKINPNDDRGPSAPPPAYVKADRGMKWDKDWEMSDEFAKRNGRWHRRGRWHLHNPNGWKGRYPSFFRRSNAYVERNALNLRSKEGPRRYSDPDLRKPQHDSFAGRTWDTAFVRTKAKRKYGYYEIKCRLMDSAISSAFWFAKNRDFEIDVFEYSTSAKGHSSGNDFRTMFMTNTHVFTGPKKEHDKDAPEHYNIGRDLSKEVIKVGLLWTKDKIVWYLNDKPVREMRNHPFHTALHLQLDSELFPNWFGFPGQHGPDKLPNVFRIFYVRSWRMIPQ